MNPYAQPIKPKTNDLDHWNAFKESQRYDDLWDLLSALKQRKIALEDKCDAERCTPGNRDNLITLGTTYKNYPADIFTMDHELDHILMAYIGINPDHVENDERALAAYREELRTQNQKIEVLAGVNIGESTSNNS